VGKRTLGVGNLFISVDYIRNLRGGSGECFFSKKEYYCRMSSKEDIIKIISGIVHVDPSAIGTETKLVDIAHDSIKLFELFIRLENELKGVLTYEEVAHIESVGDVFKFVEARAYTGESRNA
jgi:acyl carrier protein